jgi:hypothetical protein
MGMPCVDVPLTTDDTLDIARLPDFTDSVGIVVLVHEEDE